MSIEYTWGIAQLEAAIEKEVQGEVLSDVATTAHWTCSATDGVYSASVYGSIGLSDPDPEQFVPAGSLTKDIVIGWVQDALGDQLDAIENGLDAQIFSQQHPTTTTIQLN